jgi:hypothetical protein
MESIVPTKLGFRLSPSSVVIIYEVLDPSTGKKKLRERSIEVRNCSTCDPKVVAQKVQKKHGKYVSEKHVSLRQLTKIIAGLKEATLREESLKNVDVNREDDTAVRRCKKEMDVMYEKHRLKPGDPGFEYDLRKEFGPPNESSG